jgi:prepilin-type N-terminal cleavage/methylation domain-containing protein
MKIRALSRKIKKGFTLLEVTIVMLATSILFAGFTAFTLFFSNQYNYEMKLNANENSASHLKYSVSNNIEKFNYTYETNRDFKTSDYNQNGELFLFSTTTPVEHHASGAVNFYTGFIVRDYKFVLATGEKKAYFGYDELIYTFKTPVELQSNERETALRDKITNNPYTVSESTTYFLYETESRMILNWEEVTDSKSHLRANCKEIKFTIQYAFESDVATPGTKTLVFNKYVYYVS